MFGEEKRTRELEMTGRKWSRESKAIVECRCQLFAMGCHLNMFQSNG
jgi:hypothetical protein